MKKTTTRRTRITPEKAFESDLRCAKIMCADHEQKVIAAQSKPERSWRAAIKHWERELARYEVKLAKHDSLAANKARWKFIDATLARIRELSPQRERMGNKKFCAFCFTTERCIPLRKRRPVSTELLAA